MPFLQPGPALRSSQSPTTDSYPLTTRVSLCPSSCSCSPGPKAWTSRTLLGPPAPAPRSCETRCLHPWGAGCCPSKYRHQACPTRTILAAGGGGAVLCPLQRSCPLRSLRWWQGGGKRGEGTGIPGPARGAHAATALRRELGTRWLRGRRKVPELPLRVSAASGARGVLRAPALRAALRAGATAVPAAAAINLRGRSPGGGRGQSAPPTPRRES